MLLCSDRGIRGWSIFDTTGDVAKLHKDWNIDVNGAEDLSEFTWEVDAKHWHAARNSQRRSPIGLARLVERYLVLRLDKPKPMRMSNWEHVLTEPQQICTFFSCPYKVGIGSDWCIDAANDAAAAYDLQEYFTMVKEGRVQLPPPMEPKVDIEPSTVTPTSTPANAPTRD